MVSKTASPATISIDDFMTGLLASLARQGIRSVSLRGTFYDAIRDAFNEFETEAVEAGHEVDFVVSKHPVHGDSPAVRMAITHAVQRDLVSLDNPVYLDMRIKISPEYADRYLSSLPGSPALYEAMGEAFTRSFAEHSGV